MKCIDGLLFNITHLMGVTSTYQPMYGYFNDGYEISSTGNNEGLIRFGKKLNLSIKSKLGKFNGRFDLIKEFITTNSKCLEYGCNIGYNTFLASEIEGINITGVDVKGEFTSWAKALSEYNKIDMDKVNFVHMDCSKYLEDKEDGCYDCILCLLVGHHLLGSLSRDFPQSHTELDMINESHKSNLDLFHKLIQLLKNKSKRFIFQMRLGVGGVHHSEKSMDYNDYKDDFLIDHLNEKFNFRTITRVPSTESSYGSPHPIYIFDN